MKILDVEFVTSAADASGVPRDGLPQVAVVGRSNVGKSTLINALVRRRMARTSAAPGKTRLINLFRVRTPGLTLYLADLPGFGYARGGDAAADTFARMVEGYFAGGPAPFPAGVLLLVDSRHPGLAPDRAASEWLRRQDVPLAAVATKVDKLPRAERARMTRDMERALECPVLPVSAVTGEGLDALWKLIAKLASHRPPHPPTARSSSSRP